jgi:WXXGXW repeat (2 copies)
MKLSTAILIAALSVATAACVAPAPRAHGYVEVTVRPPAPRVVVVPAPRVGYVWAPGYWQWNGHTHLWVDGVWIHEKRGQHWVAAHWEEGRKGYWHFEEGHWAG